MHAVRRIFDFARLTPDAPAFVAGLQPVSYRVFHGMITGMRRRLASQGLRRGGVVLVWIDEIPVAWSVDLALRTLGLTTMAIRSIAEIANVAGLDVVALVTFAAESRPGAAAALPAGVLAITVEAADWDIPGEGAELEAPPEGPSGGHVLLTSGSTGQYKMVLIGEAFEAAHSAALTDILRGGDLRPAIDEALVRVNLFSFGLWTIAGYSIPIRRWAAGGSVVFHQGADPVRSLAVPGLTHAVTTPAALAQMLDAPTRVPRNDALRLVVAGGALSLALASRARASLSSHVATVLGSTESGVWAITPIETAEDLRWHRLHPRRMVEVVDEACRPLPAGELGQVRVLLDNGLTGYLNAPEATAEAFRDGYFYPGDLGMLDEQGRLALYGRVSEMLNVLGDKVPTQPLEQALQERLGVEGVCLLSGQGPQGAEELHVIVETAAPIDEARLREAARAIPRGFPEARFHFIARLPRNHMGKVERFKLQKRLIAAREG
ncbi:MAG: fatty acid--CoA ligase family protein [Caulobacteraceae bacterium]|nr:fatty acid--CoA ligase family protein [Caulobacteraceae bacterium]